jgi:hypothetical protein
MASRFRFRLFVVIILFGLLLPITVSNQTSQAQNGTAANWTFMVYMSGDSTLSGNVPDDLNEMKEVGSDESLNIIALADRAGSFDTNLFRIMQKDTESIPLSSVNPSWGDELNLGRPQTLSDFVVWAVSNYPAEHYVLDLWGHGIGWSGVCPDKGDFLDPAELRSAMASITDAGITLDMVSIDACQMGMLETVYELRAASRFAVVSEKDVPISGWPYGEVLSILSENPETGVEDFGRGMVDAYLDWGIVNSGYSLTLSLIDLGFMDELAAALDSYATEAVKVAGFFNRELITARMNTEEYDGSYEFDLRHLLENINDRTGYKRLEAGSGAIFAILDSCVAYERHWTNFIDEPADNAHGLSIYFPTHGPGSNYAGTTLGQDTAWDEFLTAMTQYFSNPVKHDEPLVVVAGSADTDADGLNDLLEFSAKVPQVQGQFELEVYGPDGIIVHEFITESTGWQNITYFPEALGAYSAAFYMWENSTLVNYSLFESGLNREGWSRIRGRVTSNIGRGLKWTRIALYESNGDIIGSTVTDFDGRYTINVKVPTETEGVNLTLSCGLGSSRRNATFQQLFGENNQDFELETSHVSVLWFAYATILMNIAALLVIVIWFVRRRTGDEEAPATLDRTS